MKKLIGLMICLLVMVFPYGNGSVHPATQVQPVEYYLFLFRCHKGSVYVETRWMDERISPYATFEDRISIDGVGRQPNNYVDCNTVELRLSALDRRFSGPSKASMHLWRLGASVTGHVDEPIEWGVLSDIGSPDFDEAVSTETRRFVWSESWPENYWIVKYEKEDSDRRNMTKVRYVDSGGYAHGFYAVPWARRENW